MNENLKQLRDQVARKAYLEELLANLENEKRELDKNVFRLGELLESENSDVEKFEKTTLASLLYKAMGKREERLDKERREAYAAKLKYDTAVAELEDAESRIDRIRLELRSLSGCEPKYKNALKDRIEFVKTTGGEIAEKVTALEDRAVFVEKNKTELEEAIEAGKKAMAYVCEVADKLEHAHGLSTWDIMGGGLLADMAKHEALDDAQRTVQCLQIELRNFKTELADVRVSADFSVNIDGFVRTADYFFDGFFVDFEVRSRIEQAQNDIEITRGLLNEALRNLQKMLEENLELAKQTDMELEALIVE